MSADRKSELADAILRQFDPRTESCPPSWDEFSDADWRLIAETLKPPGLPASADRITPAGDPKDGAIIFWYVNHREQAYRRCVPLSLRYGTSPYYTEPQWLLRGFDTEKQAVREFSFRKMHGAPIGRDQIAFDPVFEGAAAPCVRHLQALVDALGDELLDPMQTEALGAATEYLARVKS